MKPLSLHELRQRLRVTESPRTGLVGVRGVCAQHVIQRTLEGRERRTVLNGAPHGNAQRPARDAEHDASRTAWKSWRTGWLRIEGDRAEFVPKNGDTLAITNVASVAKGWKNQKNGCPHPSLGSSGD